MAKMATVPVFACKVCGKAVYVTDLSTRGQGGADELKALMQGLKSIALCAEHRKAYNYYASQNRADEFIKNQLDPATTIYNVRDESGVDYYGRDS